MKRSIVALLLSALVIGSIGATPAAFGSDSPATQTVAVAAEQTTVAPYFWIDEPGHRNRTGPFLVPVNRRVPKTLAVGTAALEQLLAGPRQGEANAQRPISTMIPEGTKLLRLTIADGTAKVHFNKKFAGNEDSAAAAMRAAQVVFTLTRYPTVDRVVFFHGENRIKVQTDSGELKRAVNRNDYLAFQAAISVETPTYRGVSEDRLRVTGQAAVFEAVFQYALRDANGKLIEKGFAMTDNGTGWGSFDFTIQYNVATRQVGKLRVWAISAEDGSRIDGRAYPVILKP